MPGTGLPVATGMLATAMGRSRQSRGAPDRWEPSTGQADTCAPGADQAQLRSVIRAQPSAAARCRFGMADGCGCGGIGFTRITRLCFLMLSRPPRARALAQRWSEPGCTGSAACGYGTGMEGAAAGMAAAGVHGFPAVLTSLVGRAGAVREVAGLLEEYRLVTVTGPGGVGKTRLAGEVARQVAARFADGVWLAELAPVRDPVAGRAGGGGGAGGAGAAGDARGGCINAGAGPPAAAGGAG